MRGQWQDGPPRVLDTTQVSFSGYRNQALQDKVELIDVLEERECVLSVLQEGEGRGFFRSARPEPRRPPPPPRCITLQCEPKSKSVEQVQVRPMSLGWEETLGSTFGPAG